MLFTDLVGSKALGRAMEAEHYAEVLADLREAWQQAVAVHGGTVIQSQGDGALIVFGYPESGEDDGRRAAEAALDIHARVMRLHHDFLPALRLPLRMHSGIHAGKVLLSDGDIERGRLDLRGDVANTAAQLSQHARPGEILASLDALGPYANFFELGDAPDDPDAAPPQLQIRAVLARATSTRRFEATSRRGLTPFIGRSETIDFLTGFLHATGSAAPRCAVVVGSAGIGKTRLLEELLPLRPAAFTLLRGNCESYLGAQVLQPFLQMLQVQLGTQADSALRADALLAQLSDAGASRAGRGGASGVVGELLAFFAALSARQPLVLVIDDWQWADDASRQLLEALLQLPAGPRALLASRPRDDGSQWIFGAPHLTLDPFHETETSLAVQRWLPDADPFLVRRIHAYAGGMPLFIEELCQSLPTERLAHTLDGGGAAQGWLATLVASRLGRLPPDQARVVRAAAVIGNLVPDGLLASACGGAPDQPTRQALADAEFLYADAAAGGLRFKHGITRDAVYDSIGLYERRALHQRIEASLRASSEAPDGEDAVEALAYHCRGGGHWEGAAFYAERAGDKASAAFALDWARAHYLAAMDALDRVPQRSREQSLVWCSLACKLGMTCIFDPLALSGELDVFERAVALAQGLGDANALARAFYWLGYMCYGFGRFRQGEGHARRALALAGEAGDPRLAAQINATLGQILTASCQYDEAITLLDAAVSAKQQRSRPGGGIAIGSAYTLSCKGSVLADRGDFAGAQACFDDALMLLDGSTHPVANSVRNWVAVSLVWQGRWQEAEQVAMESARIAENTRGLLLLVVCRAAAGFARWSATGEASGFEQLRAAVQWMEARRGRFYSSLYHGWLVEACAARGEIAAARQHAAQVLRRAREGERLGEAMACRALAQLAIHRDDTPTARRWLRRAEQSAHCRGSAREAALNEVVKAQLLRRHGQIAAAGRSAADAAETLRAMGMAWHAERAVAAHAELAAIQPG